MDKAKLCVDRESTHDKLDPGTVLPLLFREMAVGVAKDQALGIFSARL